MVDSIQRRILPQGGDSRVPPELLFDAGFGELFVVRAVGNVLGSEI